jgi:hypothetical protein
MYIQVDSQLTQSGLGVNLIKTDKDLHGVREYEMDHICYRCETVQEYQHVCSQLSNMVKKNE